jgi:hypothetical protein
MSNVTEMQRELWIPYTSSSETPQPALLHLPAKGAGHAPAAAAGGCPTLPAADPLANHRHTLTAASRLLLLLLLHFLPLLVACWDRVSIKKAATAATTAQAVLLLLLHRLPRACESPSSSNNQPPCTQCTPA